MPRRRGDEEAAERRGKRLAEIRAALGVSQFDMAVMLTRAADELGAGISFRDYNVSRNEAGRIGFEEAAAWLALDPEQRGWDWLVFGDAVKLAPSGRFKRAETSENKKRHAR